MESKGQSQIPVGHNQDRIPGLNENVENDKTNEMFWNLSNHFVIRKSSIQKIGFQYTTIRSQKYYNNERYTFNFRIDSLAGQNVKPWLGFGVASKGFTNFGSWHASDKCSWGYYYGTQLWHDGRCVKHVQNNFFKVADIVSMTIDNGTLSYKINGRNLGDAFTGLPEELCVVVSAMTSGITITLMDVTIENSQLDFDLSRLSLNSKNSDTEKMNKLQEQNSILKQENNSLKELIDRLNTKVENFEGKNLDKLELNQLETLMDKIKKTKLILKETITKKQETQTCVICLNLEQTHILVPCGHKLFCGECGPKLKICPVCRMQCASCLKVYQ